ncbi:hypothetical protein DAI22_02g313300 [Oryza sativa Japonica Group]|nr:hypothetical protein DAI22_02g313300 [Oryza sativa Japonica Group]
MKADPRKAAQRRISRELEDLWLDPPAYCRPGPEPVTDLLHWEVIIDGPPGTPYAGGTFPVDVWYPNEYPFQPPKLTFKTKISQLMLQSRTYECNSIAAGVPSEHRRRGADGGGRASRLLGFVSILYDPLLDYPINDDIAEQYENEYELYEKEAREWTRRYSSTPIASHWLPKAMRTPPAVPHIPATAERREESRSLHLRLLLLR